MCIALPLGEREVELSRPIDREPVSRAGVVGSGGLYLRRFAS